MNTQSLQISNVTAKYKQNAPIISNINLEIRRSKLLALLGPNGAGKSTLIRAITGVLPLSKGSITFDNHDILSLSNRNRAQIISVVPQKSLLPDHFTVRDIVMLGRTPYLNFLKEETEHDNMIVDSLLSEINLYSIRNQTVNNLSGGEIQRVVIARALAQEPKILLLDEPTAHLDIKYQTVIIKALQDLASKNNIAVLLTMHDINQAIRSADSIAIISKGQIIATGTPHDVCTSSNLSEAYETKIHVTIDPRHKLPFISVDNQ